MSSQTGLLYLLQATARVICKRHMISAVLVTCVAMFHNCKSFSFYIAGLSREEYLKDYHPARISVSFAKFGNREPPDTGKSFSEKCLDSSQTKSASIRTKIIGPSLKAGSRSWVDVVSGRADGSDLLRAQKLAQSENRGREAASRSLENMNLDGSNPVLAQCVAESEVNGGQKKVRASPGTSLLPISDQGVAWAHEPPLSP
ncbi:hypothetical protein V6N12_027156 [Hibiscus sabdariffa]|uniref:Uncharacterized protein n=1 Tax=Hibiscus sabdariffa TaxID=183260 RepID=A0ABR2DTW3_9ROSI